MVFLVVLGVAVFAGVIWLALSKKSCFKVRIAALIALGLMVSAVIVSLFVIFGVAAVDPNAQVQPDMPPPETFPPAAATNDVLLVFVFFLLGMFLLVTILSLREQRRGRKKAGELTRGPVQQT